jgi:hypothetical protein
MERPAMTGKPDQRLGELEEQVRKLTHENAQLRAELHTLGGKLNVIKMVFRELVA